MQLIHVRRDVWHTQAAGAWGLLHLGDTAISLLIRPGRDWRWCWRVEVATHFRWLRLALLGLHRDGRVRWHRGLATAQRRH